MDRTVVPPSNWQITLKDRTPTEPYRLFFNQIAKATPVIGTGSPEGNVTAEQGQLYMDDSGVSGSILYVKRDSDISGDKTKGWILV